MIALFKTIQLKTLKCMYSIYILYVAKINLKVISLQIQYNINHIKLYQGYSETFNRFDISTEPSGFQWIFVAQTIMGFFVVIFKLIFDSAEPY